MIEIKHVRRRVPALTLIVAVWSLVTINAAASVTGPVSVAATELAVDGELPAVGQLFAEDRTCSASVVSSRSGRLAMTAAHCVYIPPVTDRMSGIDTGRKPGWGDDLVFVPARADDDAPYGTWAVERMWVDRTWQTEATPELDVAFIELRDTTSGTAQEVLGAFGLRFDDPADDGASGPTVDVLGYPTAAPFDGKQLRRCEDASTDDRFVDVLEARCALTAGASGGPWLVRDDEWWTAVAVTSYLPVERPGSLGGARLGAAAEQLWLAADRAASQ